MTNREKLIDLIREGNGGYDFMSLERIADHLLANGVTFDKDINVPTKWIPVTERLPEAYTDVLAYRESGCEVECCIDIRRNFWLRDPTSQYLVTHWMPLPEPPKGE